MNEISRKLLRVDRELCGREQAFLLEATREDLDLARHMHDALKSLAGCLAADESARSGRAVKLN